MNEITFNFPFLGSLSLGQFLIACAAIYLSLPYWPQLVTALVSGLFSALKRGATRPAAAIVAATPPAADVPPEVAAALEALQTLAMWAVKYGTAQLLAKVVELFAELQSHSQGPQK